MKLSTVHSFAVSQPNYFDPDGWKPANLSPTEALGIRQPFRKRFPRVMNCAKGQTENAKPWPYEDVNISIHKAYASKRGWFIAEVFLSPYRCDGPLDNAFTSQWFAVSPNVTHVYWIPVSGWWLMPAITTATGSPSSCLPSTITTAADTDSSTTTSGNVRCSSSATTETFERIQFMCSTFHSPSLL